MDLKKHHKYQKVNSVDCGPVCVKIICDALGRNTSLESIKSQLEYVDDGVYPPQIGKVLLNHNIANKLILANVSLISKEEKDSMTDKEFVEYLKQWIKYNSKDIFVNFAKHLLSYVEQGGKVEIDPTYSSHKMKLSIEKGEKILASVQQSLLWGQNKIKDSQLFDSIKGQSNAFHFVIVNAVAGKECLEIIDPYPTGLKKHQNGVYNINENTLINAAMIGLGVFIVFSD